MCSNRRKFDKVNKLFVLLKKSSLCLRLFAVFLCLILIINLQPVDAKICNEIDARNDPADIELRLRNCTIVVGSLSIVLIERHRDKIDFNSLQFPELREITGYLLLYRVFGLKTLRYMFPNLKLIRGEKLLAHYSLIFYEVIDLTEIGLPSLIKIQQGYVMIRLCPMLCYVHTIDWSHITEKPQNITVNGKMIKIGNYLPLDTSEACPTKKSCPSTCQNCWNYRQCQLYDTGYSLTKKNLKCHEECIGGCNDETASGCLVCRNYRLINTNTCVRECPEDQYIFSNLCVSGTFCKRRNKIPFMHECRDQCPANYRINNNTNELAQPCVECTPKCPKECPAYEVGSLTMIDQLRDCQIIKGDLFIRLHHGVADTMKRLERNLGDIEEIEGVLKIYRSTAITSLSFFRNLRLIRGNRLENGKYSVVIMSNENLQKLWDFTEKKNLQLSRGNLLVHFNSKLCLSEIYALQHLLKTNPSEDFIGIESNGYEETCSARDIETDFKVLSPNNVEITVQRIHVPDSEKIVGYIIYYIIAPERNVTHFGSDTCVQYGWQTHFIQNFSTHADVKQYTTNLTNLVQHTQYAYYVKIQVVPKEHEQDILNVSQGQSNINYFVTDYDVPTCPKVETLSKTSTSITLNWFPISEEPEYISFYKVDIFRQPDELSLLDVRNYCLEPRIDDHVSVGVLAQDTAHGPMSSSCYAEYQQWQQSHLDSSDPDGEWRLHRKAICAGSASKSSFADQQSQMMKYINSRTDCDENGGKCLSEESESNLRFKRDLDDLVVNPFAVPPDFGENYLKQIVFKNTDFNATIDELLPYQTYIFQFFSCNDKNCSAYYFHFDRTEFSTSADNIAEVNCTADLYNSNRIHLEFDEPMQPNGLTVAFHIEKYDWNTFNTTIDCITHQQFEESGKRFTFDHLAKGYYTIRVRSISLAQNGAYSKPCFILVHDQGYTVLGIIGLIFMCIVFTFLVGALVLYFYRLRNKRLRIRSLNASTQNIMMQMDGISMSGGPIDEDAPSFYHAHSDREFF